MFPAFKVREGPADNLKVWLNYVQGTKMNDVVKIIGVEGGFGGPAYAGFLNAGATARLPTEAELAGRAGPGNDPSLPLGGWVMSPLGTLVSPESAAEYESKGVFTRFPGSPLEVTDSGSRFGYALYGVQPIFAPLWDTELCRRLGGSVGGPWPQVARPGPSGDAGEGAVSPPLLWGALVFGDYQQAQNYMAQAAENAYQELLRSGLWKVASGRPSPLSQAHLISIDHPGLTAMYVAMSAGPGAARVGETVLGRDQISKAPGGQEIVRVRIERFRTELRQRRLELSEMKAVK